MLHQFRVKASVWYASGSGLQLTKLEVCFVKRVAKRSTESGDFWIN